jgi:hypothetical protein
MQGLFPCTMKTRVRPIQRDIGTAYDDKRRILSIAAGGSCPSFFEFSRAMVNSSICVVSFSTSSAFSNAFCPRIRGFSNLYKATYFDSTQNVYQVTYPSLEPGYYGIFCNYSKRRLQPRDSNGTCALHSLLVRTSRKFRFEL